MRLGAHIGLGSDAGAYLVPHGEGTVDELHYLTKAGVTEEVLAADRAAGENLIQITSSDPKTL